MVAAGPRLENMAHEFLGFMSGEDEHFSFWRYLPDLARSLEAVELRHPDVEHRDLGAETLCFAHGFAAGLHLRANFPSLHRFNDGSKAPPHHLVIVCQEDAGLLTGGRGSRHALQVTKWLSRLNC